jgi:spermidine synthase
VSLGFQIDVIRGRRSSETAVAPAPGHYLSIAMSGMTALACEVIWTRSLFRCFTALRSIRSLILAVFLSGLGIGSTLSSALSQQLKRPRVARRCQLLLCAAWGGRHTCSRVDSVVAYRSVHCQHPHVHLQLDLVQLIWVVLPAAVLWGASFPLALASVASRGRTPSRRRRLWRGEHGWAMGALSASLFLLSGGASMRNSC